MGGGPPSFKEGKNFRKELMKNFLIMLSVIFAQSIHAAPAVTANGAYQLNRQSKVDRDAYSGTKLFDAQQFGVKAQWSFADQGGAVNQDVTLHDHEGNAVTLPNNAIIRDCMIDVVEPVTAGAPTSASLAFSASEVGDLKALSFLHITQYNSERRIACLPVATVGTAIKLESEATIKMRIGSEALTAGKLNIWLEYMISD